MTKTELEKMLNYDELTGNFIWRVSNSNIIKIGDIAGTNDNKSGKGYVRIRVNGERHLAHRLAWFFDKGEWPRGCIDHINGDKSDNRIVNLRVVTHQENTKNQKRRNCISGITGVTWFKRDSKWRAQITINGVNKHIGYFDTKFAAAYARHVESMKNGFHVNHGRN